jgi:hypothetical protein
MHRNARQASFLIRLKEIMGAAVLLAAVLVPATCAAAGESDAIAWLKVGDDPAKVLGRGSAWHRDPTEYEQYRKTQAALIKSPDVLRAALKDPALVNLKLIQDQANPEQWLKENITVNFPLESEVLQITLKADSKAEAVKIVNAVADSYFKNVVDIERQNTARTLDLFDREVKARMAEIVDKTETLTKLKAATKGDPSVLSMAREQFSKRLELSTNFAKKLCDIELQIIADRISAEDTKADIAERDRAKTALAIAEAQKKFLEEKQQVVKEEMDQWRQRAMPYDNAQVKILGEEISRKQEVLRDLEAKLGQINLLMSMPSRVTRLMDASQ